MPLKEVCLLCGNSPSEGMHITGQKMIKSELMPYQLCKSCCLPPATSSIDGTLFRKRVWVKVEEKLKKIKKTKS